MVLKKIFSNHEIVTLAVYLLGGKAKYINTEDIAVKANELAPGRFAWRKYPDQINIENVRTFLSDAKKEKNGAYLLGAGKDGWMLTQEGLEFSENKLKEMNRSDLARNPSLSAKEKQWLRNEKTRMLASEIYIKYQKEGIDSISVREAASFFRIDDYLVGGAREEKIVRILNSFSNDPELGAFLKLLAEKVRSR